MCVYEVDTTAHYCHAKSMCSRHSTGGNFFFVFVAKLLGSQWRRHSFKIELLLLIYMQFTGLWFFSAFSKTHTYSKCVLITKYQKHTFGFKRIVAILSFCCNVTKEDIFQLFSCTSVSYTNMMQQIRKFRYEKNSFENHCREWSHMDHLLYVACFSFFQAKSFTFFIVQVF